MEDIPCSRPAIPSAIKREVRQRCGFGCVICGMPLYEYEHMEEWAKVRRHVAEEITLLCDSHHRQRTNKLLPIEKVREADRSPYSVKNGISSPFDLHYSGDEVEVRIGGDVYTTNFSNTQKFSAIVIDGLSLLDFSIREGNLFLSLIAFDSAGACILEIYENSLEYCISPWDIEFSGTTLTVREAKGSILISMVFTPPNKIHITRGVLGYKSTKLEIFNDTIVHVGSEARFQFSGSKIRDAIIGISLWGLGPATDYQASEDLIGTAIAREVIDRHRM
ncbi:hypothetical protein [Pseudomonas baltica]|uniref:hypothetical protein n=1 Tax=Pseudomonas baltica TaxID=2762576 RepID=UPI002897D2F6|nr:hypothetical protein [Pseudomonas baltica]